MIENYSNTQDLTAAIISHFPKYDHHFHEHFMNDVCDEVAFVATIAHCLKKNAPELLKRERVKLLIFNAPSRCLSSYASLSVLNALLDTEIKWDFNLNAKADASWQVEALFEESIFLPLVNSRKCKFTLFDEGGTAELLAEDIVYDAIIMMDRCIIFDNSINMNNLMCLLRSKVEDDTIVIGTTYGFSGINEHQGYLDSTLMGVQFLEMDNVVANPFKLPGYNPAASELSEGDVDGFHFTESWRLKMSEKRAPLPIFLFDAIRSACRFIALSDTTGYINGVNRIETCSDYELLRAILFDEPAFKESPLIISITGSIKLHIEDGQIMHLEGSSLRANTSEKVIIPSEFSPKSLQTSPVQRLKLLVHLLSKNEEVLHMVQHKMKSTKVTEGDTQLIDSEEDIALLESLIVRFEDQNDHQRTRFEFDEAVQLAFKSDDLNDFSQTLGNHIESIDEDDPEDAQLLVEVLIQIACLNRVDWLEEFHEWYEVHRLVNILSIKTGMSALHYAAVHKSTEIYSDLVSYYGADDSLESSNNFTAKELLNS